MDHRPRSPGGKYLCWDHGTHRGCSDIACPRSHGAFPAWGTLDASVRMQLLRRGGTKSSNPLTASQADVKIKVLRSAPESEEAKGREPRPAGNRFALPKCGGKCGGKGDDKSG
eukprot:11292647-Heterocapsa_arctica.AAC.1